MNHVLAVGRSRVAGVPTRGRVPRVENCKLLKTKGVTVTINVWQTACKGEEKIPKLAFLALQLIHFIALAIVASIRVARHLTLH